MLHGLSISENAGKNKKIEFFKVILIRFLKRNNFLVEYICLRKVYIFYVTIIFILKRGFREKWQR